MGAYPPTIARSTRASCGGVARSPRSIPAREPCRCPRLGFFFRVWTGTRKRAGTAVSDGRDTGNPRQTPLRSSARVSPSVSGLAVFRGRRRRPFRATFPRHPTPLGKYRVFAAWRIGAAERSRDPTRARRSWPRVRLRLIAPDYLRSSPRATSRPPRHRHPPSVALTFAAPSPHLGFRRAQVRSQGARAPQEEQG